MRGVRDCSCRGSTGFAHLSCIVEYAKQKSQQDAKAFLAPWETCPNCNQLYQNQLSLDVASGEKAYNYPGNDKWDKIRVMAALHSKIQYTHLPTYPPTHLPTYKIPLRDMVQIYGPVRAESLFKFLHSQK